MDLYRSSLRFYLYRASLDGLGHEVRPWRLGINRLLRYSLEQNLNVVKFFVEEYNALRHLKFLFIIKFRNSKKVNSGSMLKYFMNFAKNVANIALTYSNI